MERVNDGEALIFQEIIMISYRMKIWILMACFLFSCQNKDGTEIIFEIPLDFHGVFFVRPATELDENFKRGEKITIKVTEKGYVVTDKFSAFEVWHSESVFPVHHHNGDEKILYNLGSTQEHIIYFFGTENNYNKSIKGRCHFELVPGLKRDDSHSE